VVELRDRFGRETRELATGPSLAADIAAACSPSSG
jgi:prolyl-tRNA synthetase